MAELTIGEFAARAGVSASAVRFYERRGLIAAARNAGNQRRFRRSQLRRVAFIRAAQRVGLSLGEVGAALASLPENRVPTRADWAALSERWRERLETQIRTLEKLRDDLNGCIGCGCLSLTSCSLNNPDDVKAPQGSGPHSELEN